MSRHGKNHNNDASQASVRKVQPINDVIEPEVDGGDVRDNVETTSSPKMNMVGNAKDFVGSAANTAGGALKNAFYGVKNSWFGLKPIKVAISAGVEKTADFLNVSKKVVSIGLAVILLGGGGAGVISIANYNQQQLIFKQEDYYDPCADLVADANDALKLTDAPSDINEQMMETAKKVWALGKVLGMTDEQCAGMLGNMQQESSMDPFSVECVGGESYQIGEQKARILPNDGDYPTDAMKSHCLDKIYHAYAPGTFSDPTLPGYCIEYGNPSSGYLCGIGLIQWTGGESKHLIDYARGHSGKYWYDLDLQLANLFGTDAWASKIERFMNDSSAKTSVADAAAAWLGYIERGGNEPVYGRFQYDQRKTYAEEWYARLHSISNQVQHQYSRFANDVIALADSVVTVAAQNHKNAVEEDCNAEGDIEEYDNSTLAAAMVAYAWPTREASVGNDGTQLYQAVHDAMYPGDHLYQSCDRGVSAAVVWSGADDNFPIGNTTTQDEYMSTHPDLWLDMGLYDSFTDELQPGDIFCTTRERRGANHGHIFMFVGNEEVQKKYPGNSGDMAHASYMERSVGIQQMGNYGHNEGYKVYRYIGDYSGTKKDRYTGNDPGDS